MRYLIESRDMGKNISKNLSVNMNKDFSTVLHVQLKLQRNLLQIRLKLLQKEQFRKRSNNWLFNW